MSDKLYFIQVRGFDGREVVAPSAGKARYREFKAWQEAGYGRIWGGNVSFFEFVRDRIEVFHHHGEPRPK